MIDLEASKRRTAWLKFLQPGDRVTYIRASERYPAHVESVAEIGEPRRIWIKFTRHDGTEVRTWVWCGTGDCPGNQTRIEPATYLNNSRESASMKIDVIQKWRELVMWYGIALADLISETNLGRADAIQADIKSLLALAGCLDAP